MEAMNRAASIRPYTGDMDTRKNPTPINTMLPASTCSLRCRKRSTKTPLPMLVAPAVSCLTADMIPAWKGFKPKSA